MERSRLRLLGAVFAAAWLLAACGGGGSDAPPRVPISRVVVAGDSLADVGTFNGIKFTVQNSADPANGFPVFPQLVAADFGITGQCNFFVFTGTTFAPNPRAGCTNFAIGGSRIVNPNAGGQASPQAIPFQLATAAQVAGGAWRSTDLILVDGGGNDAADLIGALLPLLANAPGALTTFQAFLAQQLDAATIAAALGQPNGPFVAAGLYMQKLADTYYDAIKLNTLDKGATHVAIGDMPDVTLTPRFQAGIAQATGGSATAAAQAQAAVRGLIDTYNARLRARIGSDTRVSYVPMDADFREIIGNPRDFALTNVTTPACAVLGITFFNSPADAAACTSARLDAAPPAGLAPGWWQSWFFTDGFHPTPYGHRLIANSVARALARAGWL
jgi:phospholipase/lecithinase/hemolysin